MMRIIGGLVLLIGFAVMAVGLAFAFQSFIGIYQGVTADPLAEAAGSDEPEREAAGQMLRWALVGLAGAVIAGTGALLSMIAKKHRKRAERFTA